MIGADRGSMGLRPGRLWSLWEIMESFQPALFMRLMEILGISHSRSALYKVSTRGKNIDTYEESAKATHDKMLAIYEKSCIELELTCSLASIREMRKKLAKPNCKRSDIISLELELG